jgi:hypothetical protein
MEHENDFAALHRLLALQKRELPRDTEINRFLIEFHRRQRVQLLAPASLSGRVLAWLRERTAEFRFVPGLSYASGFAALALMACLGFSQQVQVSQVDGQYKLSLNMPAGDASFAMIPTSFTRSSSAAAADPLTFTPNGSKPSATRFVLANTRVAYDATAAF